MAWVLAPDRVRLQPLVLRVITAGRSMRSAWLLVASNASTYKKRNRWVRCLRKRLAKRALSRSVNLRWGAMKIQTGLQILGLLEEGEWIQAGFLRFECQSLLQNDRHLAGEVQSSSAFVLLHLLQFPQQVPDAFLFQPGSQSLLVIGHVTVRSQDAWELAAQNIHHHLAAAVIPDGIHSFRLVKTHNQAASVPIRQPVSSACTTLHFRMILSSSAYTGRAVLSQPLIRLAPAAAAYPQSEGILQRFTHLGVRCSQSVLQIGRQRFGPRSHHHPCRSARLRNLIRMPRTHSFMAMTTVATIGHEAGDHRLHFRKIHHKLLMLPPCSQLSPTLRATRQAGCLRLIHFLQTRLGPMYKSALPRFASRSSSASPPNACEQTASPDASPPVSILPLPPAKAPPASAVSE